MIQLLALLSLALVTLQPLESSARELDVSPLDALCAPCLEGRKAGSDAGRRTGELVASMLRSTGVQLSPFAEDFVQEFQWIEPGFDRGAELEFRLPSSMTPALMDSAKYSVPAWSGSGEGEGEVIFAGFGLINRGLPRWDDYAHEDLRDKVVVIQSGLPPGVKDAPEHSLPSRVELAARLGARAVLVSPDPFDPELDLRASAGGEVAWRFASVPVAFLSLDLSDSLLYEEGFTTRSLVARMNRSRRTATLALPNQRIRLSTPSAGDPLTGRNVIGWLPGRSAETLVVSAHFDHLGLVDPAGPAADGNVYRGADDNASGVTALLHVARCMADRTEADRPLSLLFVIFDAEEAGRVGSRWFCNQELPATHPIRLVVNMDMVGRLEGRPLQVFDSGRVSGLQELLAPAAESAGLELQLADLTASPSDHSSFLARGVPAIMLFSGTHGDYNTPRDTPERIDRPGLARVANFVIDLLDRVAVAPGSFALSVGQPATAATGARVTVAMGIVPGYAGSGRGMEISSVHESSPAEQAGLRAGDRVTAMGEYPVESIYDYTFALRHFHAGDRIRVAFLRGTEERQTDVLLMERNTP